MKKSLITLFLLLSLCSTVFAQFNGTYKLRTPYCFCYTDDKSITSLDITYYTSVELYNKVIEISKKYFPKEDSSKIVLVGWDSMDPKDTSLGTLKRYIGTTITDTVRYNGQNHYGCIIHLSRSYFSNGYDKKFESTIIHELIHVYNKPDPTHTNPNAIRMAKEIKDKYGIDANYPYH